MELTTCPETSVHKHKYRVRNIPVERRPEAPTWSHSSIIYFINIYLISLFITRFSISQVIQRQVWWTVSNQTQRCVKERPVQNLRYYPCTFQEEQGRTKKTLIIIRKYWIGWQTWFIVCLNALKKRNFLVTYNHNHLSTSSSQQWESYQSSQLR
jgi:hypothetical protein